MNKPPTHPEPLDPHELELARILRALPGGEPPAALDARILRAAQDALAQPSSRRKALWAGGSTGALWGIGSAAAAILAIGIGWRLTVPPDSNLPVPRIVPMASKDGAADQDSTPVDFVRVPERTYEDDAPPPPPAVAELARPPASPSPAAPRREMAAPAAAAAGPEPFADAPAQPVVEIQPEEFQYSAKPSETRSRADAAPPAPAPATGGLAANAGRDAREAYMRRQEEAALSEAAAAAKSSVGTARSATTAPAAPAAQAAAADAEGESKSLDTIVVTGARLGESTDETRTRVLADRLLAPDPWLERIRARWTAGDAAGARASLRLYVERHPGRSLPSDLRPLLDE